MEFTIENTEEDQKKNQQHKERIEKMRKEKQLQLRRRRRIKQVVKLAGIVTLAVLFVMITGKFFHKKEEIPTTNQVAQTEEKTEEKKFLFWWQKEKKVEEKAEEEPEEEVEIPQKEEAEKEKITEVYRFETNSETTAIYEEKIVSTNAILIDESTDTIVASRSAHERISPASMTKVLTILVAAENLTPEQLEGTFVMTREITDYGYVNDCSSVGYLEGEEIPVEDLFYGTILPSGGDAAVALATYVAGSHEAFVEMMNEKLEELGLAASSHVTNCVGLYDEDHYSTVYDMAVIMKAAIKNELCKKALSEHQYTTAATQEHPEGIEISNWFLRRIEDKETGGEVVCAKTGYVVQSKNCAVSYGIFADQKPYICVTAGSSDSWRCIYDHVDIYTKYIGTEG